MGPVSGDFQLTFQQDIKKGEQRAEMKTGILSSYRHVFLFLGLRTTGKCITHKEPKMMFQF
jgi:hypothetical protein